ncbi:pyruvate carboxylase, partial [Rhizobium aethiopicum]
KGEKPYTVRPGSLLKEADLDAERKVIEKKLEREVSDFEFASYLMYPKVFTDFALASDTYGPVSVLPTPAYFYGLADGEELFADIEKGKTLVIVNQAMSATDSQGMVTVFFELNGQPRRIKVPDRAHGATGAAVRRKAEVGNAAQVGAPMPGVISRVFASSGQVVSAGDVLVSIEAMKMETAIHAEKDGTIAEVLVKAGDQIDAKDLLVVYGG